MSLMVQTITKQSINVKLYKRPMVKKRKEYWVKATDRKPSSCTVYKCVDGVLVRQ